MALELSRTNDLLLSRAEELEADALVLLNNDDTAAALAVLRKADDVDDFTNNALYAYEKQQARCAAWPCAWTERRP